MDFIAGAGRNLNLYLGLGSIELGRFFVVPTPSCLDKF